MPRHKDSGKITAIHQATLELVIKNGFVGLKMADVAQRSGMATGTLYVYYKSKEELVADVFLLTKHKIVAVLLKPSHKSSTFFETFKKMWMAYFTYCFKHPQQMLFCEQFIYSGYIPDALIQKTEAMLKPLDEFIRLGQQNGILKPGDVELIKAQIQGSIHETIKMLVRQQKKATPSLLHTCFDMAWDSVKR